MNQIPDPAQPQPARSETEVIAENLKRLRGRAGLTQEEVAARAGIPVRTVQRADAGERVRDEALQCLAQVLGSTAEGLRLDMDNPPPELKEAVDDLIAQMKGTGPWRHIPVKRILTPLDVETELINLRRFGQIPHKDPALSAEALDVVADIMGWVKDLDCLEAWTTSPAAPQTGA